MKARLKFSCPAKWEEMQVGLVSRHCLHCSKDVVDLTRMSKDDFVDYLIQNKGAEVCARVRKDQVVWHRQEPQFIIRRPAVPAKRGRSSMQLMALMGLALSACGDASPDDPPAPVQDAVAVSGDRTESGCDTGPEEGTNMNPLAEPSFVLGDLVMPDTIDLSGNVDPDGHHRPLPDVQAEFPGGHDSLYAFLGRTIAYPKWDLEHNVTGRIWAEFIVATDGTLRDAHIAQSIPGQRDLDSVVLGAIAQMPRWKPAELRGVPVSSRMRLPVVFDLSE